MKNMNKKIIIIGLLFGMFGCDEYLDIVPDQTQQIDLLFERPFLNSTTASSVDSFSTV